MLVCRGGSAVEKDISLPENWFDQVRGSGELLTEPTMANGDAQRLCERLVVDVAAQASSLVNNRHLLHQSRTFVSNRLGVRSPARTFQRAEEPLTETLGLVTRRLIAGSHHKIADIQR